MRKFRGQNLRTNVGSTKGVLCLSRRELQSLQFIFGHKENDTSSYSEKKFRVILSAFRSKRGLVYSNSNENKFDFFY